MAGEYLLNWTDDGTQISSKTPMVLSINTKDTTRTPIVLVGKGTQNYGEQLLENMLHILENFASTEEPQIKTVGMLWYNHGESTTDVFGGAATSDGLPIQTRNKNLNYYDGTKWVELITKEDLARFHQNVKNVIAENYAAINAAIPKNGDIKTDSESRIYLRSDNQWRLIWPSLVSDLYLDTKSIDTFVGVNSSSQSVKSFVGFGALYGKGYGDVGFGQSTYNLELQNSDYRTTLVDKSYLQNLIHAIYDTARFVGNGQIQNIAQNALSYLDSNTQYFYPANLGVFDRSVLDSFYDSIESKTRSFNTQITLVDDAGNAIPSATSLTAMTIRSLLGGNSATFAFDFGSADSARAFFNTGGELRFRLVYTPSDTEEDKIFKTFVDSSVGTLSLSAHDSVCTGGSMIVAKALQNASMNEDSASYGYYELPSWSGSASDYGINVASTSFSIGAEMSHRVDFAVYACVNGSTDGGANGSIIRVTLMFSHYEALSSNGGNTHGYGYGAGQGISGIITQQFDQDAIIAKAGVVAKVNLVKAAAPFNVTSPSVSLVRNFQ